MSALAALKAKKQAAKEEAARKKAEAEQQASQKPEEDDSNQDGLSKKLEKLKLAKQDEERRNRSASADAKDQQQAQQWERTFEQEKKKMAEYGLGIRQLDGDGACLFRAFADQVLSEEAKHPEVRKRCVDYMRENPADFAPFVEDSFPQYLSEMAQPATWGSDIEIQALARVFNVNVLIHVPYSYEQHEKQVEDNLSDRAATDTGIRTFGAAPGKKKAVPAWMRDEEEQDSAPAAPSAETSTNEKEDASSKTRPQDQSLVEIIRKDLKPGAQLIEMINFAEDVPLVQLAYHPYYHCGKHYNSVFLESADAASKALSLAQVSDYVWDQVSKKKGDAAGDEQKADAGSKKGASRSALFG